MKKLLKVLIVYGLMIGYAIPAFASIDTNLKYGSHGQEVVELQEYLIDNGFLNTNASGNFYSLTLSAVKRYQTSVGVPSTGYVGILTRGKINDDLAQAEAHSIQEEMVENPVTPPVVGSASTTTDPIISPIIVQDASNTPDVVTCPSVPKILVQEDYLNKDGVIRDVGRDELNFILKPKAGQGEGAPLNYVDLLIKDDCYPMDQIMYSYTVPGFDSGTDKDWSVPQKWNYPDKGIYSGVGLPIYSTTTPQTVVITAQEPNGVFFTRTLTAYTR